MDTKTSDTPNSRSIIIWHPPEKMITGTGDYIVTLHDGTWAKLHVAEVAGCWGMTYDNEDGELADLSEWRAWGEVKPCSPIELPVITSDTPETDAELEAQGTFDDCIPVDFPRQLERQRNEARAQAAVMREALEAVAEHEDSSPIVDELTLQAKRAISPNAGKALLTKLADAITGERCALIVVSELQSEIGDLRKSPWVRLAERLPTIEDANEIGEVLWHDGDVAAFVGPWDGDMYSDYCPFWCRTPKLPTP